MGDIPINSGGSKRNHPRIGYILMIGAGVGIAGILAIIFLGWENLANYNWGEEGWRPPLALAVGLGLAFIIVPTILGLFIQGRAYLAEKSIPRWKKGFGIIGLILIIIVGFGGFLFAFPEFPYWTYQTDPYLTWANDQDPSTGITINWHTPSRTIGRIKYGLTSDNLELSATTSEKSLYQHVRLDGLLPNTRYYYTTPQSTVKSFTTAPLPYSKSTSFSFIVYADPRTNDITFQANGEPSLPPRIVEDMANWNKEIAFTICAGDTYAMPFEPFSVAMWLGDITAHDFASNASIVVSPGNHERQFDSNNMMFKNLYPYENTTFSFTYGNVHAIILDTWDETFGWFGNLSNGLYAWLEHDLQTAVAQGASFILLAMHAGPINWGNPKNDINHGYNYEHLSMLAQQYGIDVIFYGHEHHYETCWINGTYYMNVGFGGNGECIKGEPVQSVGSPNVIAAGRGGYGYCRVDVTPSKMTLQPIWNNATHQSFELQSFTIY